MYEEEDTSWSFTIGVFVGAVAGAILASLFTPRSGAQNREAVRERGVVLKERVADTTSSVTHNVKDTTSGYVSSVKDTTTSVTSSIRETASSAAATVKDATQTAVARVNDTVETVKERASATAVSVSETASATVEKLQETASSAAERARQLAQREHAEDTGVSLPDATTLATEARYDAEDVRPATTAVGSSTARSGTRTADEDIGAAATGSNEGASARPPQLEVLSSLDTFEPTMADVTAATPAQPIDERAANAATTELASDEQFDVANTGDQAQARGGTSRPSSTDVSGTSEGADRLS